MKKSKQIIGAFLKKSKEIKCRKMKKSKEINGFLRGGCFFGKEYGMARLPYAGSRAVRYLHLGD